MSLFDFSYQKTALVSSEAVDAYTKQLQLVSQEMHNACMRKSYDTPYASLLLLYDNLLCDMVKEVATKHKKRSPSLMLVIGIGGSNLGTLAIHQALFGLLYNDHDPAIKLYYADTVDTDYMYDLVLLIEQELEKNNEILINVVSKSGTTTETVVNFAVFLALVQKARPNNYHESFVITTDKDSALWHLAQQHRITILEIPQRVGGRYSVLSAVGLFPLAMAGIAIDELHAGARSVLDLFFKDEVTNYALQSALCLYDLNKRGYSIHDTFIFAVDLAAIGAWYRQLLAESIGKIKEDNGKKEYIGIAPTVSIGSTDLHSVGQLYLGGPYNRVTTFITAKQMKSDIIIPANDASEKIVHHIAKKPVITIMDAIVQGVKKAYEKNKRPYMSIILPEKSAYYMGQLLQCKMVEIMYLGHLFNIDPFNQPQVELYKQETREILSHE